MHSHSLNNLVSSALVNECFEPFSGTNLCLSLNRTECLSIVRNYFWFNMTFFDLTRSLASELESYSWECNNLWWRDPNIHNNSCVATFCMSINWSRFTKSFSITKFFTLCFERTMIPFQSIVVIIYLFPLGKSSVDCFEKYFTLW